MTQPPTHEQQRNGRLPSMAQGRHSSMPRPLRNATWTRSRVFPRAHERKGQLHARGEHGDAYKRLARRAGLNGRRRSRSANHSVTDNTSTCLTGRVPLRASRVPISMASYTKAVSTSRVKPDRRRSVHLWTFYGHVPVHGLRWGTTTHAYHHPSSLRRDPGNTKPRKSEAFWFMGDTGLELASGAQVRPDSPYFIGVRCSRISSGSRKLLPSSGRSRRRLGSLARLLLVHSVRLISGGRRACFGEKEGVTRLEGCVLL